MYIRLYPDSTRVMTYSEKKFSGMFSVEEQVSRPEPQENQTSELNWSEENGFWYEYTDKPEESEEE